MKTAQKNYTVPSYTLTDGEFNEIVSILKEWTGISLNSQKKPLVQSRLTKQLRNLNCPTFSDYIQLVKNNKNTQTEFINALSTNETSFFREKAHFERLQVLISESTAPTMKIWSAACSTGPEVYSIAMLCSHLAAPNFIVTGTDINSEVVKRARHGIYPIELSSTIPGIFLKKYALKGSGSMQGYFCFSDEIVSRTNFFVTNLLSPASSLSDFNIIFLRNVMIYFSNDVRHQVLTNVSNCLLPGGYFFIGHSESILSPERYSLEPITSSVFRKYE